MWGRYRRGRSTLCDRENGESMRYSVRAAALPVAALIVAALATAALAGFATSGTIYKQSVSVSGYGTIYGCMDAFVSTTAPSSTVHGGSTYSRNNTSCSSAISLPAGYLGVSTAGYKNGSFCGQTGYQYTSSSSATASAQISGVCSATSGAAYHTVASGRVWTGSTYQFIGQVSSPSQNL